MASVIPTPHPAWRSDPAAVLEAAKARFLTRNPKSLQIHKSALLSLPGGNTRTVLHTAPFPVSMARGTAHQVTSEDNHTSVPSPPPHSASANPAASSYTDFVGEFTAALYGHSHPVLTTTITHTLSTTGLSLGATTAQEARYAALLCARFSLARLRFCNSGTEANLHALAAARAATGRRRVLAFAGGYHGGVLGFAHGAPARNNVDPPDWLVVPYNDAAAAVEALRRDRPAAVLVEAMQGAAGCVVGDRAFLLAVRAAAREVGAVFVLDEVMTSRMGPGGLAERLGLEPDLVTFGKYLGGGLAFGAFGGTEEVMRVFDPRGEDALAQSGTFNNNTLAMAAGYAGLKDVYTPEVSAEFMEVGEAFLKRLREATEGTKATFTGVGTVISLHITDKGVRDIVRADEVEERDDLKDIFWFEMMEEGFWITRRGMIALILGTPQSELDRFVGCVKAFLERHRELMVLGDGQARAT
ncbi:Aminotransferase [Neofusicoccum parvum]|nr:Aminotransferase [Neofusicoccum parvum]